MLLPFLPDTQSERVFQFKPGRFFDRVFIVILENQAYQDTIQNTKLQKLAKLGTLMTNFYAITHPSQPNYFALTSGNTWINSDKDVDLEVSNIIDLLEAKSISWKAYQEDLPWGECYTGGRQGKYYRKHNPFISYDNVRNNASRCERIVNADELYTDIIKNRVPQYAFYTPNIDNDGHDTGLSGGVDWVYSFMKRLLAEKHLTEGTLIIVTYDEDDYRHSNQIFTLLIGSMVKPGAQDSHHYTHYSLLRTIEENWDLGTLQQNDVTANVFQCFVNSTESSQGAIPVLDGDASSANSMEPFLILMFKDIFF
jgi:hypothetical protein